MRDGRVDVFAISSADQSARFKTYQNGIRDSEWTPLGGKPASFVSVCSRVSDNLHAITLDDVGGVYHKWTDDGGVWKPALVNKWERFGGYASITVEMGCAEGRVDLVAYGRESEGGCGMTVKRGNGTAWMGWEEALGRFRGDLMVVEGPEGAEFFGVAEDGGVRWREWDADEERVRAEEVDLGGKFMSVVSGVSMGERMDLFAVVTDARLWHKARIGRLGGQGGRIWEGSLIVRQRLLLSLGTASWLCLDWDLTGLLYIRRSRLERGIPGEQDRGIRTAVR